jgi:hypothetical protein
MSSGGPPRSCCSNHRCGGSRPRDSLALPALELAGQRVGLPHPGPTAPLLAKITSDEETVRIEPATRDRSAAQVPHDRFRHRNAASGTSASATFQSSGPGGSRLCVGGPAQPRGRARHPVVGHAVAQRPTEPAGRAHRPVEEGRYRSEATTCAASAPHACANTKAGHRRTRCNRTGNRHERGPHTCPTEPSGSLPRRSEDPLCHDHRISRDRAKAAAA